MKTNIETPISDRDMEILIDKYFSCTLSDREEYELRRRLARSTSDHPSILMAKGMMGFNRQQRKLSLPVSWKFATMRRWGSVAAAIALIAVTGIMLYQKLPASSSENKCIAYANGATVTDEEKVMEILAQNLSDLDEGAAEAASMMRQEMDDLFAL